MYNYYIKKLGKQELGISSDGTIARGRYIYISKSYEHFFPHLSTTVKNDNVLLPIIPPFSDDKIYTTLVYHNDKYCTPDGTRDEFRLYLNREIDPDRNFYKQDDIIVFQKVDTGNTVATYILYKFNEGSENYVKLQELIDASEIRGGHAFIDTEIDFIPHREINLSETKVVIPEEIMKEAVVQQAEVLSEEQQGVESTRGASLFGSESFRDFVMMAYEYKCAVTGKSIVYKNLNNLETAHIQPRAQAGTYLPCNGIALSRDIHWAFDKGFITISDDYKVILHDEIRGSILEEYNDKQIFVPKDPYFQPEKKFLQHHRDRIFGLFLHSGTIRSDR
jgi:hypothetical protein